MKGDKNGKINHPNNLLQVYDQCIECKKKCKGHKTDTIKFKGGEDELIRSAISTLYPLIYCFKHRVTVSYFIP